jgi:hypothetical protein
MICDKNRKEIYNGLFLILNDKQYKLPTKMHLKIINKQIYQKIFKKFTKKTKKFTEKLKTVFVIRLSQLQPNWDLLGRAQHLHSTGHDSGHQWSKEQVNGFGKLPRLNGCTRV